MARTREATPCSFTLSGGVAFAEGERGVRCSPFGVRSGDSLSERRTPNAEHRTPNAGPSSSNPRRRVAAPLAHRALVAARLRPPAELLSMVAEELVRRDQPVAVLPDLVTDRVLDGAIVFAV